MLGLVMRPTAALVLLSFLLLGVACGGDGGATAAPPGPAAPAGATCEAGERTVADGCEPIVSEAACGPGARAAVGSATCEAVGPAACPAGFVAHASGWGCRPVIAPERCEGAMREALGSPACVPVGDCSVTSPPAGASVFVDASFTDDALDATHVRTIGAAVTAASAGATIAIAPGTYPENVALGKAVTLVGRCAEKVIVEASVGSPAIAVNGAKVALRGMTVRGGSTGLYAVALGADVTVADAVLEKNQRAGIEAFEEAKVSAKGVVIRDTTPSAASSTTNGIFTDAGATVRLEDGVVSGAADAGVGATGSSAITLVRSVVRDTVPRPDGVGGTGARAFERGTVELVESAIVASRGTALIAGRTKAVAKIVRSSVVDTKLDDRPGLNSGTAVSITDGASLEVEGSTVADNAAAAFAIAKEGTRAKIANTAIVATKPLGEAGAGVGLLARGGASVELVSSAVVESAFAALQASDAGTTLVIDRSLVAKTAPSSGSRKIPEGSGGTALAVIRGGSAVLRASTIDAAREAAIAAANEGSTLELESTLVTGTLPNAKGAFGHGVLALLGARVGVARSVVERSAAVGVVFADASGSVRRSTVRHNAIGIHAQQGSTIVESEAVPEAITGGEVVVTTDSRFTDNASKVGSGVVPLPNVVPPL